MATLKTQIKLRRGTYTQLQNIVLAEGEPCFITDRNQLAIGNGTSAVKNLELFNAGELENTSNYMTPEDCGYRSNLIYNKTKTFADILPNLESGHYTIIQGLELYSDTVDTVDDVAILGRYYDFRDTPNLVNVMFTRNADTYNAIIFYLKRIFYFIEDFNEKHLTIFEHKYYNGIPAPHVRLSFHKLLGARNPRKPFNRYAVSSSQVAVFSAPKSTTAKIKRLIEEGFVVNFIIEYLDERKGWSHLMKQPLNNIMEDVNRFKLNIDQLAPTINYDTMSYQSIQFKIHANELFKPGRIVITDYNSNAREREIYPINNIRFIGSHNTIHSLGESGKITGYQGLDNQSFKRPYGKIRARISAKHVKKNIYITSSPSAELKVSCCDVDIRKGYTTGDGIQFTIE